MTRAILYHERLDFVARGPALLAVALIVLALVYAASSGAYWRDARLASLEAFEAKRLDTLSTWRNDLVAIEKDAREATPYDANPMGVLFPAILPPASLADFAIGHADLQPASAEISPWRNLSSMFGRYQFDNPTTLASSRFDVALVIVMLLPVLMSAVSFDVLAADRGRGTLPLAMSFPVRLSRLAWTRLLFRNGLLWLVAVTVMAVLIVINGEGDDRVARFGLWLAVSLAYGLFWLAAIALCVAAFRTAMSTAGVLVAAWMLFTLAIPAAIATVSEATYPTPSRLAYLSEIRNAQADTNRELAKLTAGFLMDHPDLTVGDDDVPSYFRAAFLSNQAARENTRSIVDAYEAARRDRARTLEWAQYLSPAIITQRLLYLAAGADLERQHAYQTQARTALDRLAETVGPAVVSRNRITVAEFDGLSPFSFQDRPVLDIASSAVWPLTFLLVLSVACGVVAHRRLDAARVHE